MGDMDMISELPDDLILKILSSLFLKDVIATSVLSKRWTSLWKLLPKVKIGNRECSVPKLDSISTSLAIIDNPQVFETLDIKLDLPYLSKTIDYWVKPASVYCGLRELRIELLYRSIRLPSSLYTCKTLKTLILRRLHLKDHIVSSPYDEVCLSSLKTLGLLSVKFSSDESVGKLLKICPVLEDLVVRRTTYVGVKVFTIDVPTLKSLSIDYLFEVSKPVGVTHGFEINTPSLRYLNIRDRFSNFLRFTHMAKLVKANVEAVCDQSFRV